MPDNEQKNERFTRLRGEFLPDVEHMAEKEQRSFANMVTVLIQEALTARGKGVA